MTVINLMNRRAALRALEIGQCILWAVTSETVTDEMRLMADAAAKTGVRISQQHMIAVNPKGGEVPRMAIMIERVL